MGIHHIAGITKRKIFLYALSTCGWCKKTKEFLNKYNIAFDYIDVDLLDRTEQEKILTEMKRYNPRLSFPTIIIDDKITIVGYDEGKLREVLEL
jgi:glutaredoxin